MPKDCTVFFTPFWAQPVFSMLPQPPITTICIGRVTQPQPVVGMPYANLVIGQHRFIQCSWNNINMDIDVKDFLPFVYGELSVFICAMWAVDLTGFKSCAQLYVGGLRQRTHSGFLFFYGFPPVRLPKRKPKYAFRFRAPDSMHWYYSNARKWLFSSFLHAVRAAQITNSYGDLFLGSFGFHTWICRFIRGEVIPVILLSISQMSETLFILAIPFFLRHFGIKRVMLISMFAWVFRRWPFRTRRPGIRIMDADTFNDRLWDGIWFLQHFGFSCLLNCSQTGNQSQRPRTILYDDQRIAGHHRRICQRCGSRCRLSRFIRMEC